MRCFILLQYLYFILCLPYIAESSDFYKSLLLTKINGKYHLTKPRNLDIKIHTTYFKTPKKGETYRFCPSLRLTEEIFLHKVEKVKPNEETTDKAVCEDPIKALLVPVRNPGKLKKIAWNTEEMELLHSGFLLYNKFSERLSKKLNFIKTRPDYGPQISEHKFVKLIEFYFDKKNYKTLGAEYTLPSVEMSYMRAMSSHKIKDNYPGKHVKKTPPLFFFVDSPQYVYRFKGKISKNWMLILISHSQYNPLSLLEFVSYEHFALSAWTLPVEFNLNYVPLWKFPKLIWIGVEIFARVVAKYLGELKVIAGVTGTMTLGNKEVIDIEEYKMPKFFWKVFQYHKDKKSYGIIVVLNCNPFEETEEILCKNRIKCGKNGWVISNENYLTGKIYCCAMTKDNIENLKVNFVSLSERLHFNLHLWENKRELIQNEYQKIISNKQYMITIPVR